MATPLALSVLLLAGIAVANGGRIVGGQPAPIERYPSIVQVDALNVFTGTWSQSCGANILTSRHVLSAAHCFDGSLYEPSRRRIRAGTADRNFGGSIVYVEREFIHPSYGQLGLDGDICVVRLLTALVFSPVIQQGTIVAQGTQVPDNMPVVHAGWGATSQGGPASSVLLDTTIYTVNNDLCLFGLSRIAVANGGRIVGGQPAPIERYPSIVQVDALNVFTSTWSQSCGANILTSRYVLSAAHCFDGFLYEPSRRRIRAGTADRNFGGSIVYVEREFNHPSYGQLGMDGDICVVRLSTALVYSPVIQQGTIIAQGTQVPDNVPVVHAGWGATSVGILCIYITGELL
ncbi:Trypsin, alkaline C [Papilio machaon]|uniref:Trypsin, alkaline C n=1 Tax=Papilio machaon TaxID=76193 RepID=A0A0N1IPE5_PAPMA|nr:Trypsin, alkaline C [Papilio machaon]